MKIEDIANDLAEALAYAETACNEDQLTHAEYIREVGELAANALKLLAEAHAEEGEEAEEDEEDAIASKADFDNDLAKEDGLG